jgi:hypothetical protein
MTPPYASGGAGDVRRGTRRGAASGAIETKGTFSLSPRSVSGGTGAARDMRAFSFGRSRLMQVADIQDYARQLFEAHGDKAVAEAAQRAADFEKQGEAEQAEKWRRIESAIYEMLGPHQS